MLLAYSCEVETLSQTLAQVAEVNTNKAEKKLLSPGPLTFQAQDGDFFVILNSLLWLHSIYKQTSAHSVYPAT